MVIDQGFEIFWAHFPRKIGKLAARAVWLKLKPDAALVAIILESVEEHRRTKAWREGFICHPVTFLRQGRYLDELGYDDFPHAKL